MTTEPIHLSHTTVPSASLLTTVAGQILLEDWSTITLSHVDHDGQQFNGTGRFIIRAHGFDYEDHDPADVWLQLIPVAGPDAPETWHGARRSEVADPGTVNGTPVPELVDRTPAPAGWVNKPGAADLDLEQARTAIGIARKLAGDIVTAAAELGLDAAELDLLRDLRDAGTE